jgi:hypothetical protein
MQRDRSSCAIQSYRKKLRVTLNQFITSEGFTARQAAAVISAFGVPEGLSSREPLSRKDQLRFRGIAKQVLDTGSTVLVVQRNQVGSDSR